MSEFNEYAAADEGGDESPTDKDITAEIDRLLAVYRPDRYDPSNTDWWDPPVVEQVERMLRLRMSTEQIVRDDARKRVAQREKDAPKRLNALLRKVFKDGRLPLGWGTDGWRIQFSEELALPVAIRIERGGREQGRQRIRFGAMSTLDTEKWEVAFRRDTAREHAARNETADGMVFIRELMEDQRARRFDEIRFSDDEGNQGYTVLNW